MPLIPWLEPSVMLTWNGALAEVLTVSETFCVLPVAGEIVGGLTLSENVSVSEPALLVAVTWNVNAPVGPSGAVPLRRPADERASHAGGALAPVPGAKVTGPALVARIWNVVGCPAVKVLLSVVMSGGDTTVRENVSVSVP